MRDEIKSGINPGNVCCLSVQNFFVCRVSKIKANDTKMLSDVFVCGREV
jgi:hypothetical protein